MKIAVYAIAKQEAAHVARFCEAAKDADLIVVADTGSTDDTVKLLKKHGVKVHQISITPWRFDDARNACLALLPADIDVCVSLDLDEVLQPGWREEIEARWIPGETNRLRYQFDWGCGIAFGYEKIHARHGFRWTRACHEVLVPDRTPEVWAETPKLLVVHQPDQTKSRGQYLDLLRVTVEEHPTEPQSNFYLCREYSFNRMWQDAIDQGERYLALPKATAANERCYAMRVIGRCYEELGQPDAGLNWHRRACSEAPDTREPWCDLALLAYRSRRWGECLGASLTALDITHRENLYTVDPAVWGPLPHDLASQACWHLGDRIGALTHAKAALELEPADARLRGNVAEIERLYAEAA